MTLVAPGTEEVELLLPGGRKSIKTTQKQRLFEALIQTFEDQIGPCSRIMGRDSAGEAI